jgi:phosphonopyruvate decarboxylase
MNRLDATRNVVDALADDPIVASLGHPAYDLFAAGDRPANFYTWGSMGLASSIGLGLAMARPDLACSCSAATDRSHESRFARHDRVDAAGESRRHRVGQRGMRPGMQTATAHGADLETAAQRWGVNGRDRRTADALTAAIARAGAKPGPWVIVAKVTESAPSVKPPLDCVFIKQRFMAAIGQAEEATGGGRA